VFYSKNGVKQKLNAQIGSCGMQKVTYHANIVNVYDKLNSKAINKYSKNIRQNINEQ